MVWRSAFCVHWSLVCYGKVCEFGSLGTRFAWRWFVAEANRYVTPTLALAHSLSGIGESMLRINLARNEIKVLLWDHIWHCRYSLKFQVRFYLSCDASSWQNVPIFGITSITGGMSMEGFISETDWRKFPWTWQTCGKTVQNSHRVAQHYSGNDTFSSSNSLQPNWHDSG